MVQWVGQHHSAVRLQTDEARLHVVVVDAEEVDVPKGGHFVLASHRASGNSARNQVVEDKGRSVLEHVFAQEKSETTSGGVGPWRCMDHKGVADAREEQDDGFEVGVCLLEAHNVASLEEKVQPSDPFPANP